MLNDIHIDIMDYIKPAYCNEAQVGSVNRCNALSLKQHVCFQFRGMWTEFEWENRVNVSTAITLVIRSRWYTVIRF